MTIYVLYYLLIAIIYFVISTFDFHWNKKVNPIKNNIMSDVDDPELVRNKWRQDMMWFVILSVGLLIVLLGLRAETMGIDLLNTINPGYLLSFEDLNKYSWMDILRMDEYYNYEKGYIIFNKLIGSIWVNRQFFLMVCAFISFAPVGLVIFRYSKMPLLSVIIFLGLPSFIISFSGLRQGLAIGITMLAFDRVLKKKPVSFILLVLLASTFHSSALMFLIVYPVYRIRLNDHASLVGMLMLPLIWILRVPLVTAITTVIWGQPYIEESDAVGLFLVFFAIYVFCHFYGDRYNDRTNGFLNLFWIACAIQSMAGVYHTVTRMGYYFMMALILLLPEVYEDMNESSAGSQKKILVTVIGICFVLFGLVQLKTTDWAVSYPYIPFWVK